jgi:hypothetical protein
LSPIQNFKKRICPAKYNIYLSKTIRLAGHPSPLYEHLSGFRYDFYIIKSKYSTTKNQEESLANSYQNFRKNYPIYILKGIGIPDTFSREEKFCI